MLDTQFRMHPLLGQFISKNFYENHGLPPIKAGRPETDFIHNISGYATAVCTFKHISNEPQQRPNKGSGWHRPSEAKWIAQEAKRILDEKPELSVGIISFYRGQVDTLFNEMSDTKIGLTVGDKIAEPYRIIETGKNKGDERLRIGTVDAFQGKEFDVVFVSLVRTLPETFQIDELDDQKRDQAYSSLWLLKSR
jgi:superfamily I DNA and/or RNA helicase